MELKEADYILETLYIRVTHILDDAVQKQMHRMGIAPKIAAILHQIHRLDNPTPLELAHFFHREPQTITAIIYRMERKGLVEKKVNPRKRNTYRIHLTEKGLSEYQKTRNIDILTNVLKSLSEEKRKQLQECLEEMMPILIKMGC